MNKKEVYRSFGIDYKDGKIYAPIFGWIRPLLVNGNAKIGPGAYHFSTLPTNREYKVTINGKDYSVKGTCPCFCNGCYATKGNYNFKSCIASLAKKTILAYEDLSFVERAITAQIIADKIKLVRIHAAGDFFSIEYAEMWKRIAIASNETVFWTYTKNKAAESLFDDVKNANIVKSIIPGIGFNFGKCDYIMRVYHILKNMGKRVHICFCGIEKFAGIATRHCTDCKGCSENEFVLFIEHSTSYKAETGPLFPDLVKLIMSQE